MATKSNKKSFRQIIENLIWTEGTYGERPIDPSAVIRENMDKIKKIQDRVALEIEQRKHQSK